MCEDAGVKKGCAAPQARTCQTWHNDVHTANRRIPPAGQRLRYAHEPGTFNLVPKYDFEGDASGYMYTRIRPGYFLTYPLPLLIEPPPTHLVSYTPTE